MRLSIITDELSDDLDVALDACARLGLAEVELRTAAGRSILALTDEEVTAAIHRVRERGFAVSALATPIFKCSLPDAPARAGELRGAAASATIDDSWRLLARALEIGTEFDIPVIRAFSFWRVAEPAGVFEQVVDALREALVLARGSGVQLALENEHDCNIATAAETAKVLERLPELRVIWDPANHVRGGGQPEEAALRGLEDRIAHVHLKDVDPTGTWVCLGDGLVPYRAVFDWLLGFGYDGALSFETHCQTGGSTEAATRRSLRALDAFVGAAA